MRRPANAAHWAQRAEEAKKTTQTMRNPMAKKAMERLASTYEAYARSAAKRGTEVVAEAAD
jgi:hypothetical protein